MILDYKYKISIVIPIYNCEKYIGGCIESLFRQTMPREDYQIVMINDGSADNSGAICEQLSKEYPNITYFSKENGGVSRARNKGMELSEGKYILFLDADDTLSNNTLEVIYDFFEEHYDETDLVTYRITPYWEKERFQRHYRFKFLKKTGVYDLTDAKYCYTAQTTMNICIKNNRENPVCFDTKLKFHEDQKFCYEVLKEKMTIGFCKEAEYLYLRHPQSTTRKTSYAYYIFESSMAMWEELFSEFDEAPAYLQSLFINDINWKGLKDILLPYHYSEEEYKVAVSRIIKILNKIDSNVILKFPDMDPYHKHYLLKLKGENFVEFENDEKEVRLTIPYFNEEENEYGRKNIYKAKKITAVVTRFGVFDNKLVFDACLKSLVFQYCDKPEVYLVCDGKRTKLELTHSEYEYYHAKIKNSVFWRIQFDIDVTKTKQFKLELFINGNQYPVSYYYMDNIPFKQHHKRKVYFCNNRRYSELNGVFSIKSGFVKAGLLSRVREFLFSAPFYYKKNPRILLNRILAFAAGLCNKRIWLYLDRYGVYDNAYQQFKHDFEKEDKIKKIYVLNACDYNTLEEKFSPEERKNVIKFGSFQHKMAYIMSEKIITSFSNLSNICPFGVVPRKWYTDLTRYEVVYLQHGLLHASLRNMYSKERCVVDKVVVSSQFEVDNLTENYGYRESDLIKSGMPRYDFMTTGKPKKNRIVFCPSWRSNLIGPLVNNSRVELRNEFVNSEFYKEINAILNSDRLHRILEENDLYLDFRNHPIFKCYNDLLESKSDRIKFGDFETEMDEYSLMITDYSSIVFDSVYLGCPVLYFVPDYDLFRAGISHGYRELDLPLEEGFGPLTLTADQLLDELEKAVKNKFVPEEPYKSRMDGFFLYNDNNCRERIYNAMK